MPSLITKMIQDLADNLLPIDSNSRHVSCIAWFSPWISVNFFHLQRDFPPQPALVQRIHGFPPVCPLWYTRILVKPHQIVSKSYPNNIVCHTSYTSHHIHLTSSHIISLQNAWLYNDIIKLNKPVHSSWVLSSVFCWSISKFAGTSANRDRFCVEKSLLPHSCTMLVG